MAISLNTSFKMIPRRSWRKHVGRVVMYGTKTDEAYYTGILDHITEDGQAVFRFSTWIEPKIENGVRYGREFRILDLKDITGIVKSVLSPETQESDYNSTQWRNE